MASSSTHPVKATNEPILTPVMTLQCHKPSRYEQYTEVIYHVSSISYFPDGQKMVSGNWDRTARQWNLQVGKEIKKVRDVFEGFVHAVEVSRDGRWVVTAGGKHNNSHQFGELRVCEVETGIVKTLEGHSTEVTCIDVSADSTLLASGSCDSILIWGLDTGKPVAGPFKSDASEDDGVGAVRFSQDSKKLAVTLLCGKRLDIWDVHTQKLDARVGKSSTAVGGAWTRAPVFWTAKDRNIIAAFCFIDPNSDVFDFPRMIYKFDASTLKTVGAPFEGHTSLVTGLALSFDGALLASASLYDNTIKLWAFESRQLLASFRVQMPHLIILSPNSHQLAYTTWCDMKSRIFICDIPPNILASIWPAQEAQPNINTPHNPRRAVRHNLIKVPIRMPKPLPTIDPQQPTFLHYIRKLLPFSRTDVLRPIRNHEPHDPLDFPATLPLPPNYSPSGQATTQF
ncbi:WD40 repeat-like protein [Suillus hirtellus]|nr:WD40 repeat-like protein [Suillus hirtellus]